MDTLHGMCLSYVGVHGSVLGRSIRPCAPQESHDRACQMIGVRRSPCAARSVDKAPKPRTSYAGLPEATFAASDLDTAMPESGFSHHH